MDYSTYTVEKLDAQWDTLKNTKVRYGEGETGWAKIIEGSEEEGNLIVAIANTPLEPRLRFQDIVTVGYNRQVGEVLWRAYAKKTAVEYPAPDKETAKKNYAAIFNACKAAKLSCEGYVAGTCGVCHHEDTDLAEVLSDIEGIKLRTDWDDETDADQLQ